MSNSASNRNLNIEGSADGSVVVIGDGNIINSPSSMPASAPKPFGVPYQRNRYFTGREAVLTQLHEQLTQSTATAITQVQAISGLGGIGKTQTAVEYAYRYHYDERVYDTVFWVKADTEVNLAADFAGIANQLALPMGLNSSGVTQMEKIPAVQAWLATHHNWLLIFDNADTPDWLTSFMPTNPQGKVLITSRVSVFDQLGIRVPLVLDVLSSPEAIDLIFERTRYPRTKDNVVLATELNQELGGLPLALEQASAFIVRKKIGFQPYLNTYRKRGLSQLEKENAKTGQYFSSVQETWKINFEAVTLENPAASALLEFSAFLSPDEIPYRVLFAGAPHLDAPLGNYLYHDNTVDDDEMLIALSELLAALNQYSLVKWEPEREVYSVHRLVQATVYDGIVPAAAHQWIEQAIVAITEAYPGGDFKCWGLCAQLLSHWLMIIRQAKQSGHCSESLGLLLYQAGVYLHEQGRYIEAEPLYEESLSLRQQLLGDHHLDVASSLTSLAGLYYRQERYSEAEPLYEEALSLRQQLLGDHHLDVASSLNNLSGIYSKQGRYSEAESLAKQALELTHQLLGDDHLQVATSLNSLAWVYTAQGRYSEAEPLYQKALSIRQQLFCDDHPKIATSLNGLAGLYSRQERYSEAEVLYQQALAMRRRLLGNHHPKVIYSLNGLARVYAKQGRYSEAESLYEQALFMRQQLCGAEHPAVAKCFNRLAWLYEIQGDYGKATSFYEKSLNLYQRKLGNEHPSTQSARKSLQSIQDKPQGK
ncbi:MAG: DUF2225 domain-containing protein [Cyanobacteria bacterium P01_F01_bin.53]